MGNDLLGKEIIFNGIYRKDCTRIVVGIDPTKGITLADPNDADIRCCITPEYFGAGYAGAYFEAIRMLKHGRFNAEHIDEYATRSIKSADVFFSNSPNCPYV